MDSFGELKNSILVHYTQAMEASEADDYATAYQMMRQAGKEAKQLSLFFRNNDDVQEYVALSKEFESKAHYFQEMASAETINVETFQGEDSGFDDFIGLDHIKDYLRKTVVEPWKQGTFFNRKKAAILFYGPRGVSKTKFAQCLVSELGATGYYIQPFHYFDLSDCPSVENRMNRIFADAETKNNVVFFIEQPAPFFPRRENDTSADTADLFLRIFKNEIKRIRRKKLNILFVATTSVPDKLTHKAFSDDLFNDFIRIDCPDEKTRRGLLLKRLGVRPYISEADLDLAVVASDGLVSTDVSRLGRLISLIEEKDYNSTSLQQCINEFKPLVAQGFKANVAEFEGKISKFEIVREQ